MFESVKRRLCDGIIFPQFMLMGPCFLLLEVFLPVCSCVCLFHMMEFKTKFNKNLSLSLSYTAYDLQPTPNQYYLIHPGVQFMCFVKLCAQSCFSSILMDF